MLEITEEEVLKWLSGGMCTPLSVAVTYITQFLNKEYPIEEAREDVLSFR